MARKTVLVLANNDVGLYIFRKALLKRFLDDGHKVVIALPDGECIEPMVDMGCEFIETPIERRGMNPIRDIKLYKLYKKIIKKVRPDIVVTYTVKPNVYGGFACRVMKIPYAVNITGLGSAIESGGMLRKLVLTMYKVALKKAKIVFFENEGNREKLLEARVVRKEKTCVLNGAGIETSEYPVAEYPADGRTDFLFVGRIMKEKGVDELFYAIERLKKEHGSKVGLDIIGMFEESYQQKIDELQAGGIIAFHGFQDDVKSFYERAHCIVHPSYHEGMSNVLLEAGAMGRPLITSSIHGCMEAVEDGKTGYLCEVKNKDSLYEAMKQFVQLDYVQKKSMAAASHELVSARFEKKQVVAETVKHLY